MEASQKLRVQGRDLSLSDISFIRKLIKDHQGWSRRRISEELSQAWDWRNAVGHLKDMACRSMLLKLEKSGHIILPPRRCVPVNRMLQKKMPYIEHDQSLIESPLLEIQPIRIVPLYPGKQYDNLFCCLMSKYHYKSYKGIVGENMKYIVFDRYNRVLACLLFGSSAWKVESRDKYIGWDAKSRESNLSMTTNNMRFLILPWVKISCPASHILGLVSRRISFDWQARYSHPLYMLETFVEKCRFKGTCYKASNWIYVGQTKGRSRNDRYSRLQVPIKDVYLYPLHSNFQKQLMKKKA